MTTENTEAPTYSWAVPEELGIPPDPLRLRLDFHHQSAIMTLYQGDTVVTRQVDAMDVAYALASDLSFGSGLLPDITLGWQNAKAGPVFALYVKPQIRKLALPDHVDRAPRRFQIPLPGMVFICTPGNPPWVFAVKKKPTKVTDIVFRAPLCNIFHNGRSCPGSHTFPTRIADIVQSFFSSFFSQTADLRDRSKRFPRNIVELWEHLDKKKVFPNADLIRHGTIQDLMQYE